MNNFPAILFALVLALLYGSFYHVLRGGGPGRLFLYMILSILGFGLGHLVSLWQEWKIFPLGSLNLGISTAGSLLVLVLGDWLSRIEPDN